MSETGKIIDGQHRLLAIIEAGKSLETLIVSGVKDIAFETIDSGRSRTPADILSIIGYPQTNELASLARLEVLWRKNGTIIESGRLAVPTTQEIVSAVNEASDAFMDAIRQTIGCRRMFGVGSIFSFYWLRLGEIDANDRVFFFERLVDGQGLTEGDSIYALRQALLNAKLRNRTMPRNWVGGMLVKAWNKYRNHEKVKYMYFNAVEEYPKPI